MKAAFTFLMNVAHAMPPGITVVALIGLAIALLLEMYGFKEFRKPDNEDE